MIFGSDDLRSLDAIQDLKAVAMAEGRGVAQDLKRSVQESRLFYTALENAGAGAVRGLRESAQSQVRQLGESIQQGVKGLQPGQLAGSLLPVWSPPSRLIKGFGGAYKGHLWIATHHR
jgi:hypothetical protein